MSENMIAIYLYIGILLMAGTVLVLTVIYFVRSPITRTGAVKKGTEKETETQTVNETEVEPIEITQPKAKKVFKMPFIKAKAEGIVKPVKEKTKHEKKNKEYRAESITGKSKKKPFNINLSKFKLKKTAGTEQQGKKAKEQEQISRAGKPENKETLSLVSGSVVPQATIGNQAKKENAASPASNIKPAAAVSTAAPKSETSKPAQAPKESPKTVPTVEQITPPAAAIAAKSSGTAIAENKNSGVTPNAKTGNEPVKKETEPKMDTKNTASPAVPGAATPAAIKPPPSITPPAKKPEQKSSLDDMSKMFSKDAVDDSEATKLAKDMKDVEIDNLVKDGMDIVGLLKRNRS
jgi:hypothetical protein